MNKSLKSPFFSYLKSFALALPLLWQYAAAEFSEEDFFESDDDIPVMTYEELLGIAVSSTTKSDLSIQKAPGIVRVVTERDMEAYHYNTLKDVLLNIPGVQVQEYRAGHQLAWTRGVQARYNNKVLLLVDGVPLRDNFYGHFSLDEALPLEHVERIEIINGPGSVLYGANAFSSVINVTTKAVGDSISISKGTFDTVNVGLEKTIGDFYLYADQFSSDSFRPERNSDGSTWDHPTKRDRSYVFTKYQNNWLTLVGSYTDYEYPEPYRTEKKDYIIKRAPIYLSANVEKDFGEKGTLSAQAYYSHYTLEKHKTKKNSDYSVKSVSNEEYDTELQGIDVRHNIKIGKHSISSGISFQEDAAADMGEFGLFPDVEERKEILVEPDISRQSYGLYVQDVVNMSEVYSIILGARTDSLSDYDSQFNYQIGATGKYENGFYGKALMGSTYRVPSYREYLDVLAYTDNLVPENLTTTELQFGYLFERGDVNVTLFHNAYDDFIGDINIDTIDEGGVIRDIEGDEYAFNFQEKSISGLELYGVLYPTDKLHITFGGGYLFSASETLGDDAYDPVVFTPSDPVNTEEVDIVAIADLTLNLAVDYKVNEKLNVGFNTVYFSDREKPVGYHTELPAEAVDTSNADGFMVTSLFGTYSPVENFEIKLKISNAADKQVYSLPYGGGEYDSEWASRNVEIQAKYKF